MFVGNANAGNLLYYINEVVGYHIVQYERALIADIDDVWHEDCVNWAVFCVSCVLSIVLCVDIDDMLRLSF